MNNRFLPGIIICLVITLSTYAFLIFPCSAKEDTAHLTFRKKVISPQKSDTYTYTVKKSENLLAIIKDELGITEHRVSIIRRYNPGIRNLNLIHPGQKIILPSKYRKHVQKNAGPGEGIVPSQERDIKKAILPPNAEVSMTGGFSVMQAILGRMNASMLTTGRYVIPLPDIGQMNIDCEVIPVIEFDDGSVTFLDFKNQMPENIKNMIRKYWTNYSTITVDTQDSTLNILA
ncbi:MAG: hypothetical protein PHN75_14730, partial [Syntrophales bacterium]|nr:hypothetical protein [Syntrophales bacterium]